MSEAARAIDSSGNVSATRFANDADREPLLFIEGLSASYRGEEYALKNLDFSMKLGERVAVIGSSGSGKSTLLKCINGSLLPQSGSLFFESAEVAKLRSRELRHLRRRIGFIFQESNLVGRKSVIENVLYGRLGYKNFLQTLLSMYGEEEYRAAQDALLSVNLSEKSFVRADELSGGQKQRVAIARILVQKPALLMADEPVSALDPVSAERILDLFCEINETHGIGLLANLHDVRFALRYFPRIIALKNGQKVFDAPSSELSEEALHMIYGADK